MIFQSYLAPTSDAAAASGIAATAVDLDAKGTPLTFRTAMAGPDGPLWLEAHIQEWRRLLEEHRCLSFESPGAKPPDAPVTYYNPQVKMKVKEGKTVRRVRGTAGGDRLFYPGRVSAETASLATIKVLLHAVVSELKRWAVLDIKDFYLGTPLERDEWLRVPLRLIPDEIQAQFRLQDLQRNGCVLVRISKGIYGLPQAGALARDRLVRHLASHGYVEAPATPYELQATYSAVRDTAVKHPTTTWPGTLVPINNLIGFWSRFNEICLSTLVTRELSRRDHLIGFTNRFNEICLGYAGHP